SLKDTDAAWGYDHIKRKFYYGYKVHLLYDLQSMTPVCYTVTTANRHDNTQKPVNKYRIQDYIKISEEDLNQLYKNRMDCEHANFLLKEHLGLSDLKTTGREKVRVKVGITLIARLIQALHQLIH